MSWQRVALEERLRILAEQLQEQLAQPDASVVAWLEHQIHDLMAAAACSGHCEYISQETCRVLSATGFRIDRALEAVLPAHLGNSFTERQAG